MTIVASNYARKERDFYQTEPWVTEALIHYLPIEGLVIWDPAAGNHLMSDVLAEHGARVMTSDIKTYDRKHSLGTFDFFGAEHVVAPKTDRLGAIVANPPYGPGNRTAVAWAEKSLALCGGWVALLLTAKFDSARGRAHLFRDSPRFWAKIVLLDRISWTLDGVTGTEDHAWFLWGPRRRKDPILLYEERPR